MSQGKKTNLDLFQDSTIPEVFFNSVSAFSDSWAMAYYANEKWSGITYQKLAEEVLGLAKGLVKLGIQKGQKVGILSENRPEWGMAYLAILQAGAVVVPIDSLLKPAEIINIINQSETQIIFVSSKHSPKLKEVLSPGQHLKAVILIDEGGALENSLKFSDLTAKGRGLHTTLPTLKNTDLAEIIFTSGTTGNSKGVMLTHKNILSDIWGIKKLLKLYPKDNFLSVLPLNHVFESTCGFLTPLFSGAQITYARSLKSKELLEDIKGNKITLVLGVPLLYEKIFLGIKNAVSKKGLATKLYFNISFHLTKSLKILFGFNLGRFIFKSLRQKAGLSSLRLLVCGGAPLPAYIAEGFDLIGIKFLQGYGLTETSPVLTLNPLEKPKYASVGKPILGVELKINNPDQKGIGEIIARGDMIMSGYYQKPDATSQVLKDSWFYTGDSGWVDSEGYFYICGRIKNVIVTAAGKNIYPEEIENELLESPFIAEVLISGKKIENREEVYAMVVPNYEYFEEKLGDLTTPNHYIQKIIKEEINKCCANLAEYKRVKGFEIREQEFEKTPTKKIKRFTISDHRSVAD
ncbi:MAG: hypothetical protein A2145_00775 [candidate division Zixibacteria bacterium RBG_16_40_9]|nr:MAG: hypothetical protein A2145_00775 [candidate division Zixibacteria bacterium RBG_16_40_9]